MHSTVASTDKKLRALLESIFDIRETLTFEDLLNKFTECVDFDFACLFYIREKRWFDEPRAPDFLKFQYFSFELSCHETRRFRLRDELDLREQELIQAGYTKQDARLCTILFKSQDAFGDVQRIVNLIKRIFVAFYQNCGGHEHFRESVSRRFIKEFYLQEEKDIAALTKYIVRRCGMDVSIWDQRDEMYFHEGSREDSLLRYRAGTDHSKLTLDRSFRADLKTSVVRKTQTYGKSANKIYYAIHTFSDDYFIDETTQTNFKTQQKAVAIYSSEMPISLDSIFQANRLISHFLRTTQETEYHSIVVKGSNSCVELEAEISADPVSTIEALWEQFRRLLDPILKDVANHTRAEFVCVRLYEPFTNELVPLAFAKSDASESTFDLISIKADQQDSISAHSFAYDRPLDIWHIDKLRQDLEEARRRDQSHKASEIENLIDERLKLRDCCGGLDTSSIAFPLRKGTFLIGVIEFCSSGASRLSYESRFFELVASICGDVVRRLELANDRGWLARMSFIHAARHRIEAILRDLGSAENPAALEFVEILHTTTTAVLGIRQSDARFAKMIHRITDALARHDDGQRTEEIVRTLNMVRDVSGIADGACEVIADIFETLAANAAHSKLQPRHLSVGLVENDPSSSFVRIDYAPESVAIRMEVMESICVAPIPDEETYTYHYGLFLLSTQVRMLGGVAYGKPINDDGLGGTEFGVSFLVPI